MNSIYQINKGANRAIEFKGLKAQYIGYLAGGLVALLLLFTTGYLLKVSLIILLPLVILLGTLLFILTFRISHRYGQHGLMKKMAKRSLPVYVKFRTRKLFIHLDTLNHD